ncbi:MAG: hypothetical protein OXI67_15990 [Candidatus Poribacteria bacterium]|nr:hypothetical protein [Candidatus Poribacteria bacterium]
MTSPSQQRFLTWRVLLIFAITAPINCYFLIQMELVRYTFPTWVVPFSNVIFILTAILLINIVIRLLKVNFAFGQGELLFLYVTLSFATTLAGCDILQAVLSVLGHGFWFATEENEWQTLFWHHLPQWLTVSDKDALRGYYLGDSSLYLPHHLRVWVPVVGAWLLLFTVIAFIFLCLNTILRQQWSQRERLTFPVIQLPLAMTDLKSGFFRNKRMWIGFAIAAGISLFNGLSHLYPVIPHIPVTRRFFRFSEPPLSLYGTIITAFYPFAIGIMFLMPLDVLFSTTFFYFIYRNEVALADAVGWKSIPRFPYLNEQTIGAFIGLCFFFWWTGKRHFKAVLQSALKRGREPPALSSNEPMPYRVAVWGFVIGVLLFAFLLYKAGMTIWIALAFAVLFLITPLVTTRIRAESGIFVHAYHWQAPRYILNTIIGTHRLGAQNLTALSVCFFNRDYRPQQMPHQLEAFKIAEVAKINPRRMLYTIIIATVLGGLVAFWAQLHLYYQFGADSGYYGPWALGYGRQYFSRLTNWITYPLDTDWIGVIFIGIGFSVMMGLTFLRVKFFWLPLHPLGYVMASNQEMSDLWIPLLIALTLKWLILRHGGIKSYRRAVPFFLGLVLGDYLMGSTWSILNVLLNTTMYQFYP